MIGEVAKVTVDVAKEAVREAAREAAKEAARETTKEIGKSSVGKPDITKRIDVDKKPGLPDKKVDVRKRIDSPDGKTKMDVKPAGLSDVVKDYISDLKNKSEFADTIKNKIDPNNLEVSPTEKVKKLREEFEDMKSDLRNEWEKINNKEWPRYKEDVYNSDGVRIRKAGDRYDAHHIQPLQLGGKNEASNITPLRIDEHKEIHSKTGSCTKMVEKAIGGGR